MKFLAAAVQMTSRSDLAENLRKAEALIAEAAARGAKLIGLPENFALFARDDAERQRHAERLTGPDAGQGPIVSALSAVARRHAVGLVLGGMPERSDDSVPAYNSSVYLSPDGRLAAVYRKIHLFDVSIPDGATYAESATTTAGKELVVIGTPWAKVGLSVCYDLRFPELYRALAAQGAELLTVPAAFTLHTGRDHWHVLLRARAIENLAYVMAPAQLGANTEKRSTYGHSLIVDPWGHVLAEVGDVEGIAVAEIDLGYLAKVRQQLPSLSHRKL